jgi:hypothetical protein
MNASNGWITTRSEPLIIGEKRIVLEARAFSLRLPFGGLVWNRPVAVRVQTLSGESRLPIHDVTRRRQIAAYGFSIVCILLGLAARRPK